MVSIAPPSLRSSEHTDGEQYEADGELRVLSDGGVEWRGSSSLPDVEKRVRHVCRRAIGLLVVSCESALVAFEGSLARRSAVMGSGAVSAGGATPPDI